MQDQDKKNPSENMSLFEHLAELRKLLMVSLTAIFFCSIIAFVWSQDLFNFLTVPFHKAFIGHNLIGTGPAEAFILKLKAACFAGLIMAAPVICWQIWLFIVPGLYEHERRLALPFILSTTFLFLVGVWFAYSLVVPFAFQFFQSEYSSIGITPTIRISEFLSLIIKLLLAFGLVFEMPILAYFLGRLGLVSSSMLIHYFRHATVAIFIISAILTPPDVVTQCLMAIPLTLLYSISIVIVKATEKKQSKSVEN